MTDSNSSEGEVVMTDSNNSEGKTVMFKTILRKTVVVILLFLAFFPIMELSMWIIGAIGQLYDPTCNSYCSKQLGFYLTAIYVLPVYLICVIVAAIRAVLK